MEEKPRKSKFKLSYIVMIVLVLLLSIMVFTNNGYKGDYLSGGEVEIEQLSMDLD